MSKTIKKGRLTNDIKHHIAMSVQRELDKMLADTEQRAHDLALAILKNDAGEHWDTLLSLPFEFISITTVVNVTLNNDQYRDLYDKILSATGERVNLSYTQSVYLKQAYPGKNHHFRDLSSLDKTHQTALLELTVERQQIVAKQSAAFAELKNLLSSVTTIQRLIEIWPDVEDHLPEKEEKANMLPAVKIDKLKELIPVEEKAA